MIERTNIVRMLSSRSNAFHSAFLTCYSFDPIFFESALLPALHRAGVTNVVVLMDAGRYDALLSDPAYHCHRVGMEGYTLVRQEGRQGGVFHPKIVLLLGSAEGAVAIGSGNITWSGMSNNAEVWNLFHASGTGSANFPLLRSAWNYLSALIGSSTALVCRHRTWIGEQCAWLDMEVSQRWIELPSGERARFVGNTPGDTMIDALSDAVGEFEVVEMTVLAPFYDAAGEGVRQLRRRFHPAVLRCFYDPARGGVPEPLLSMDGVAFHRYRPAAPQLHAKMIQCRTTAGSYLLSGSANIGTMALGVAAPVFNDEAGVLLCAPFVRDYVTELGLEADFKPEARSEVSVMPCQPRDGGKAVDTRRVVTVTSCELRGGKLYVSLSAEGIEAILVILDSDLHEVCSLDVVTACVLTVESPAGACMVVLRQGAVEVSNRCLVIKEEMVELCNPDPRRRRLTRLLDDGLLLGNLNHILGYIEFDDVRRRGLAGRTGGGAIMNPDDDTPVGRDRFDVLRTDTAAGVRMHHGVRILTYLQKLLFDDGCGRSVRSDEDLKSMADEEECGGKDDGAYDPADDLADQGLAAMRMRADVMNFLNKMRRHLDKAMADPAMQAPGAPTLPLERGGGFLPRLTGVPGLNESSAFAVAATVVASIMALHGGVMSGKRALRDTFVDVIGCYIALYGQASGVADGSLRAMKSAEMLRDATTMLYVSLSMFHFGRDSSHRLALLVLNSFDAWRSSPEDLAGIVEAFKAKAAMLDGNRIDHRTYATILSLYDIWTSDPIPVNRFADVDGSAYIYRSGYGFFHAREIVCRGGVWSFSYYHPRYTFNGFRPIGATTYKGYSFPWI